MSELQTSVRLKIHEGKLEEFKKVATACMESVRTKDSGTLQYDWFLNADESECIVRERYRDSDSVLEHSANLGDTVGVLLETCDFSASIFGAPSEKLMSGLDGLDVRVYSAYQSI